MFHKKYIGKSILIGTIIFAVMSVIALSGAQFVAKENQLTWVNIFLWQLFATFQLFPAKLDDSLGDMLLYLFGLFVAIPIYALLVFLGFSIKEKFSSKPK